MSSPVLELFYWIADRGSARARRYVVDHALEKQVRFRNLTYAEVETDWRVRGGRTAPSLWDGTVLHQGADSVIARLQALVNVGHAGE